MTHESPGEIDSGILGAPLELPCGVVLKNRLVKAAMSDSLGDGAGCPSDEQCALFSRLAHVGSVNGAYIWPQLGHAGALAHAPISRPAGPSALNIEGLRCDALSLSEVEALPSAYASAAAQAKAAGFSGVEIHAGHGFLLSQFLSPLFNRRSDRYGGSIEAR